MEVHASVGPVFVLSCEELAHARRPPEELGDSPKSRDVRGVVSRPARLSGGFGAAGALAVSGGRAFADDADPSAPALSRQAQPGLHARPRRHAGEVQSQLQQFLRVQHQQAHRRERIEDPAVDGQARRSRREGADARHRRSDQGDGARGAALPASLRRGVVDGDSVDGFPAEEAGRIRQAPVVGDVRPVRDLPRQEDGPGPAVVHALALCRGSDHGGGDQRTRLHRHRRLRQAASEAAGRADPACDPWKYGFKSIKSIVRVSFVDKRPETFWESLGSRRIRLLGQRQSGRAAPALEPGRRRRS